MPIKLIATDMDGTFLHRDNTYNHERFMQQFKQMQQQNIHFVAASGSQHQRLMHQFADIKDQMDFISENGSIVYHGQQLLAVNETPDDIVSAILSYIKEKYPQPTALTAVCGVKAAYIESSTPKKVLDALDGFFNKIKLVDNLFEATSKTLGDQIVKIMVTFANDKNTNKNIKEILKHFNKDKRIIGVYSGLNTVDFGIAGVDKATGIKQLQDLYHIKNNEIVTFGDNLNDLPMLRLTPYGIAMLNANPKILSEVDHITPENNEHDGVLNAIDKILDSNQYWED